MMNENPARLDERGTRKRLAILIQGTRDLEVALFASNQNSPSALALAQVRITLLKVLWGKQVAATELLRAVNAGQQRGGGGNLHG